MTTPDNRYRLPRTVTPIRYELLFEPDLETFSFTGSADIEVAIGEPASEITLNATELEFGEAWLETAGQGSAGRVEVATVRLDPDTERAHLELASEAPAGPAHLHIGFTGSVNDRLKGFYRSNYTDASGTHAVATTQMQPVDARSVFPCWDEPDFKAVFSVTLVVPADVLVASNGPEISSGPVVNGKRKVRFADTMKMSSYLLAFIAGRLDATEPVDVDGVPLRVIHAPGRGSLTGFAVEVAAHSLRFFSDYYGIPYPERKLDLAGLPDFAAGAMENPGLITFRETALLINPATATQPELERVAETVAHEVAHMWFGDLVTMRWWNGTWLNEAFATFMSLLCIDAWRPEWRVFETYALGRTEAFEVDALSSTRAIEYEVVAPSDVDNMFDVLTYQKGASVLWMLERFLGAAAFRNGIRRYLLAHAYGNTETNDLWFALEEETGQPVRDVMDAWIWQGGFPLVTLSADEDRSRFSFAQQRFSYSGDDGTRWPIPLRVRILPEDGEAHEDSLMLSPDGGEIVAPAGSLAVGNAGSSSFVRTRYDGALFGLMARTAQQRLSSIERYVLVDDTWASVNAGAYSAVDFLALAENFWEESEASVWKILVGGLSWCDRLLDGEPRERFRAFVRDLAGLAMRRAGWEPRPDEDDLVRDLRGTLMRAMGILGRDPETMEHGVALESAARSGERVDAALASAAVSVAAIAGGEPEWEGFARMYEEGSDPQIQRRYMGALAAFKQPALARRTRERMLEGFFRPQDRPFVSSALIANRENGEESWAFVKEHWQQLTAGLPPLLCVYAVEGVRLLLSPSLRDDVAAFFASHPAERGSMQLTHVLERHRVAVSLYEREAGKLGEAFSPGGRFA